VRQLVEALKAIADPQDDMALFHALSGPLFGLNLTELSQLSGGARREQIQLAEALATSDEPAFAAALKQLTEWREIAHEQSVGSLAYTLMTDSGWKQRLYEDAQREPAVITQIQALAKYFTTLKEFERIAGVPSVQNYAISLPVLQAAGSQFEDPTLDISDDQVNVLSVHRAKGLEWETVYIVDCTEGSFPLSRFGAGLEVPSELQINPSEADEHMAEERRLMYVAATRARQDLVLSYSNRHGAGATRRPSRFLQELLGHEPDATAQEEAGQTTLELFAPKTSAQDTIALPESMRQNNRLVLSVSQIETWLRCPQDFYYKYVLNMPLPPAPQLAYGSLVHGVIERIHKAREQGAMPELRELTASVVDNLPRAGYQSARSRDRASQQAIRTVKTVFERFSRDDLPIETELPFSIEVEDLPLTIRGRIDAVYKLGDGVEIRDFKTGTSVRTAEQAKSRVSGSQQLTLYALAWQQLRGELPAKLSLDFVETGQIYGIRKQAKSLDTLHAKLEQMVSNLQAGEYPAGRDHKRCMHPIDD
jgi:DNA helicase-2/ATP-dependent DNA helicase PcrA